MNTKSKRSKGIIGITLAAIMIASIFAAIAPSTTADVKPLSAISIYKETSPNPSAQYNVSDTITYKIIVTNPALAVYNWTGDLTDTYENGTTVTLATGIFLDIGDDYTTYTNYTVTSADESRGYVRNKANAFGTDGSGNEANAEGNENSTILGEEKEPPEFAFTWDRACCRNISFVGWSSDPTNVTNHTWNFGDGSPPEWYSGAPGATVYHTYTHHCGFPPYIVTLSGCADGEYNETSDPFVWADCDPTVIIKVTPSCYEAEGTDIVFNGSDSYANAANVSYDNITWWNWTFDDGINGTSDNAMETTRLGLNHAVTATLEVSDGCCNATGSKTVEICSQCKLRLYGTFGEGAGDPTVTDENDYYPENWPYTEPNAPFYPQHEQAPRKDFITFNPAIMEHNDGYDGLTFYNCPSDTHPEVQQGNEKVFKRMWYEKEWFKDHSTAAGYGDNCYTVVIDKWNDETGWEYDRTMCLEDWNAMPDWKKAEDKLRIRVHNNDPTINDSNVDIYGPAIIQEFTYMFVDEERMPRMIEAGSSVLIPMAHHDAENDYSGLNSFDALPNDGISMDYLRVESEATLGFDIDGDDVIEPMDGDDIELSGDETVVFVLPEKTLRVGDELQLFDHKVELVDVFGPSDRRVVLKVSDNEGGLSTNWEEVTMSADETAFFYRADRREDLAGNPLPGDTFYVRVEAIGWEPDDVRVEVGRMFGQTYANIATNVYWNQKAFMVDGVFYNVVAIKAYDNCTKFITFRQKLPKMPIKLYGKHLTVWNVTDMLPEMPPFNMVHDILIDVQTSWTIPKSMQDKIGPKLNEMPPLYIDYVEEAVEERYRGELKEIYNEENEYGHEEFWELEWFHTYPEQYTAFRLPPEQEYLVTLSWYAPEAETTIWDGGNETEPIAINNGDRVKFWYRDCTGPLYIDNRTSSIRLYGTFDEGPGDPTVTDENGYYPENMPYTEPNAPFYPQHWQAPEKDFMTFNPAIMEHNDGYDGLTFYDCGDYPEVQQGNEKVFKRMWYEKEWFKDHSTAAGYGDNCFTVVIDQWDDDEGKYMYNRTMCLADWNAMPDWIKVRDELRIREHNNDLTINDSNVDIYGPAINQEFTYMFVDEEWMPTMIADNSKVLIPMAHQDAENDYRGLNSFDAVVGDGISMDYLSVESEETLGFDIDGDGVPEPMDGDGDELSGDETVVLVLPEKTLYEGDGNTNELLFFDHKVVLDDVSGPDDRTAHLRVWDTEGKYPDADYQPISLQRGERAFFHRGDLRQDLAGNPLPGDTFYVEVIAINWMPSGQGSVRLEVGRMFGQTYANIATNTYWNQKAFMVDGVLYNVVAIKAEDNCIKYITFRQKLPKDEIKLYGKHLRVWDEGAMLPEMPPFNMNHDIVIDVQPTWTRPYSQQDKIGAKREDRPPLVITYVEEDVEARFRGELKEIYNESDILFDEFWELEWFHTYPEQYTAFVMPKEQGLYLMTLAWYAPEAETTIWDGMGEEEPIAINNGDRVKFWYDPADNRDIYVNRIGEGEPADPEWMTDITLYYDMDSHGGNGNGGLVDENDVGEVIQAIMDYINDAYPFVGDPALFGKSDLIDYIMDYLTIM